MKALFELFRRFDARRIFGFIRRLGGMSRPKVKCYDLRSTHALRVEGDLDKITWGDTSKVNLDLHVYDIDAHFAKLAEKMEAEKASKEKASGRIPGAGERNKAKMEDAV